jgi:hypothetical protein
MGSLLYALGAAGAACCLLGLCGTCGFLIADERVDLLFAMGNGLFAVYDLLDRDWILLLANGALAVWCAWMWFRRRRNRKRAMQALGYKSAALLAALARRAREAAQPRPVLRPSPQGVS